MSPSRRSSVLSLMLPNPPLPRKTTPRPHICSASSAHPQTPPVLNRRISTDSSNPAPRSSLDSGHSSFFEDDDYAWTEDQLALIAKVLEDGSPSPRWSPPATPYVLPFLPDNLVDSWARELKKTTDWPHSVRSIRLKLRQMAKHLASKLKGDYRLDEEDEREVQMELEADSPIMSPPTRLANRTPSPRKDENVFKSSLKLQRSDRMINHVPFHPYTRPDTTRTNSPRSNGVHNGSTSPHRPRSRSASPQSPPAATSATRGASPSNPAADAALHALAAALPTVSSAAHRRYPWGVRQVPNLQPPQQHVQILQNMTPNISTGSVSSGTTTPMSTLSMSTATTLVGSVAASAMERLKNEAKLAPLKRSSSFNRPMETVKRAPSYGSMQSVKMTVPVKKDKEAVFSSPIKKRVRSTSPPTETIVQLSPRVDSSDRSKCKRVKTELRSPPKGPKAAPQPPLRRREPSFFGAELPILQSKPNSDTTSPTIIRSLRRVGTARFPTPSFPRTMSRSGLEPGFIPTPTKVA